MPAGRVRDWTAALAAPAVVFLAAFFYLPLAMMVLRSVTEPPGAGLDNYESFLGTQVYVRVLVTTITIAVLTTVVTLLLAYPYAYLMNSASPRIAGVLLIGVLLPFWSSVLVRTYAWSVILRDTGIINRFLIDIGVIESPIPLIRTTAGVVLGMSHVLLPFMVLPLYAVMRGIDPEMGRAASNLGAGPMRSFVRVFLPLSMTGVLAGSLLVFVLSLGFYITPAILGSPFESMISQVIVEQTSYRLRWGFGSAIGVVLLVLTLVALAVSARVVRVGRLFGGDMAQ